MVHDDYKEMFPAHALSALDAAEERALNEHLEVCVECRRDLAEWEAVAASLALSADPLEPSAEVRRRLLTQIQSEKSVSNVVPLARTQRNLWNSLGSLGQIAALLLFAALIIAVIVLWQQTDTSDDRPPSSRFFPLPARESKTCTGQTKRRAQVRRSFSIRPAARS